MIAEKSPEVTTGWKRLALWLAGGSSFLYVCSRFLPCAPPAPHGEIEDSYMQALHTAFAGGWQFGRDFVFTFGSWGFLYGGYHPATHTLAVIAWLGLALIFWGTAWLAARRLWANTFVAWLWVMGLAAVAGLPVFMMIDVGLKGFVVLLWLFAFFLDDRPLSAPQAVLAVALGLLSLVKFSVMLDSVVVVALISLDAVVRHRRFPWVLLIFGASVLLFWIAARQQLSGLGPFLRYSWLFTRGFSESMMSTGPKETMDICLFLSMAALLCVVAGWFAWARRRWFALFPLAGLGLLLFTAFKYGYVRHDGHEVAATLELVLLALILPALARASARSTGPADDPSPAQKGTLSVNLRTRAGNMECGGKRSATPLWLQRQIERAKTKRRRRCALPAHSISEPRQQGSAVLSLVPVLLALGLAASTFSRYYSGGLLAHFLATLAPRQLAAPAKLLQGKAAVRNAYEEYLAAFRSGQPLGPLPGPVDTYPGNAAAILAQGLAYRPRPIMQSYQAYSPEFAELNASFLRGPQAPESILFQLFPIDDHFPTLDDGLSWPELLSRYDVRAVDWSGVILHQSRAPRPWRLVPLGSLPVQFGQVVPLPAVTNAALWAKLDPTLTLVGRAASTLYKPPILWLTVWTQGGQQLRFRLVPGLSRGGFVLSPLVQDSVSFGLLASSGGLRELDDSRVVAVRLSPETASGLTSCYESSARLELFRLESPGQELAAVVGFRELTSLWQALRRIVWLSADYPPQMVTLPGIGSVLRVAPRSAMQLPLEGRPARLRIAFGVFAGDPAKPQAANLVVFRVSALGEGGARVELWSRQLDPSARKSDQGKQQAVVDLSEAKSSELILETLRASPKQTHGPECYWSAIELE